MSSQTISLPAAAARPSRPQQFLALLPGTLLLFAIGIAGKGLESLGLYLGQRHIPFPHVEYVLWAIILGLIISNFLTMPRIFRPGIATYELWLKLGILLVGAKFLFADVLKIRIPGRTARIFRSAASKSNSQASAKSIFVITAISAELKIFGYFSGLSSPSVTLSSATRIFSPRS